MMWEMITWAYKNKFRTIDLAGAPSDNIGLRQFKEKWGSKRVEYNSYEHKSLFYRVGYRLREVLKRFIRIH